MSLLQTAFIMILRYRLGDYKHLQKEVMPKMFPFLFDDDVMLGEFKKILEKNNILKNNVVSAKKSNEKGKFTIDISNYPDLPSDYLTNTIQYRYLCQMIYGINEDYDLKYTTYYTNNILAEALGQTSTSHIFKFANSKFRNINENQLSSNFSKIVDVKDFENKMNNGDIVFKIWDEFPNIIINYLQTASYPHKITHFKIYVIYQFAKYAFGVIKQGLHTYNYTLNDLVLDQITMMSSAKNKSCRIFIEKSNIKPRYNIINENGFGLVNTSCMFAVHLMGEIFEETTDGLLSLLLFLITANAMLAEKIGNYEEFKDYILI